LEDMDARLRLLDARYLHPHDDGMRRLFDEDWRRRARLALELGKLATSGAPKGVWKQSGETAVAEILGGVVGRANTVHVEPTRASEMSQDGERKRESRRAAIRLLRQYKRSNKPRVRAACELCTTARGHSQP
jgi:hypothetical protein